MDKAHEKALTEHEEQRKRAHERHFSTGKLEEVEKAKPHHDDLDETLADTFPSSDPIATGGETAVPPGARKAR